MNKDQEKTLSTLIKHSDDIYSLTYLSEYNLHYVIDKEPKGLFSLLKTISKSLRLKKAYTIKSLPLGCSTFYCSNNNNEKIFGRNFDYRTSPCLVVKTAPKDGYKSIAISDLNFMLYGYKRKPTNKSKRLLFSPFVCMDGMNEKGVAISVLELHDNPVKQNNNKKKITTSIIIRYVLDRCAGVDEAVEAFKSFDMHSMIGFNYHFHVVDKHKSIIIEYVKNELRIIEGNIATNFYLSKDGNNKKAEGFDRYDIINDELTTNKDKVDLDKAFDILDKVNQHYYFCYKHILRYYVDTCYSAVYNLEKLEVSVKRNNKTFSFAL